MGEFLIFGMRAFWKTAEKVMLRAKVFLFSHSGMLSVFFTAFELCLRRYSSRLNFITRMTAFGVTVMSDGEDEGGRGVPSFNRSVMQRPREAIAIS